MKVLARVRREVMDGRDYDGWKVGCDWAEANGLDPTLVTREFPVEVVLSDAGPALRYEEYVTDEEGRVRIHPDEPRAMTREVITLCRIPMPDRIAERGDP